MKKIFIYSLSFLVLVLSAILISLIYIQSKYANWNENFNKDIKNGYIITSDIDLGEDVDKKTSDFSLSASTVESLALSPDEVGYLLFQLLSQYSTENFRLQEVYIKPAKSVWVICANINILNSNLNPWLCMDLNKDNTQSPQLYTTYLKIGPFDISKIGDSVKKINTGISNSLLTVNENGFSERYLENIELLKESFVVKGSRY